MTLWNVYGRKKVQRMKGRDRRMEQDEVKEEVRGHTISGIEGYAKDFVNILRSTGGHRKHFDKEE